MHPSARPNDVPGLDLHSDTASTVCPSERLATAQIYPDQTSRFQGYTDRLHNADRAFADDSAVPIDGDRAYPFDSGSLTHQPGAPRGQIRRLHQSSVFHGAQKAADPALDSRVKFTGRLITSHDGDSLREMTGFFIPSDGSIAVYEYKRLNKTTNKTFPFFPRKLYAHMTGRRRGTNYRLTDVYPGAILSFDTSSSSLPDSVKAQHLCFLKVSAVDNSAKKVALLSRVPSSKWPDEWKLLHTASSDEQEDYRLLKALQKKTQYSFQRRQPISMQSLYRTVQSSNQSRKDQPSIVDPEQFLNLAQSLHLNLEPEECLIYSDLLASLYGEPMDSKLFVTVLLGSMHEDRKKLVLKAFLHMDVDKKGKVSKYVLEKYFKPSTASEMLGKAAHAASSNLSDLLLLMKGEQTREERRAESALSSYGGRGDRDTQAGITLTEFELFHEWVSLKIESEDQFEALVTNWWGMV